MTLIEQARKLRPIIERSVQSLDNETALAAVTLFPTWAVGTAYTTGMRVKHSGVLYTALQANIAQADWEPEAAPSLWAKVLIPNPDAVPTWEQPESTNAYKQGDRVTHGGKTWVSTVDGNVWEPGVYGWEVTA